LALSFLLVNPLKNTAIRIPALRKAVDQLLLGERMNRVPVATPASLAIERRVSCQCQRLNNLNAAS
jgi:hypothetical protein